MGLGYITFYVVLASFISVLGFFGGNIGGFGTSGDFTESIPQPPTWEEVAPPMPEDPSVLELLAVSVAYVGAFIFMIVLFVFFLVEILVFFFGFRGLTLVGIPSFIVNILATIFFVPFVYIVAKLIRGN
jgi:hypothetical protein